MKSSCCNPCQTQAAQREVCLYVDRSRSLSTVLLNDISGLVGEDKHSMIHE